MVVLFEFVSCMGKKSVVSFTFALPFCFSFLLFGEWICRCRFFGGGEVHVVECCSVCQNFWFKDM